MGGGSERGREGERERKKKEPTDSLCCPVCLSDSKPVSEESGF